MDATQALRDTENALREFIADELARSLGPHWLDGCGVTPERIEVWKNRKRAELARQPSGVVEERLIYYSDFYDLKPILKRHWASTFSAALGDWKTTDVFLTQLERLRDPNAHGRDLLPHQENLILGIAGEIRGLLIRYRNTRDTVEDCFPRFESIRDSLGNLWVPGEIVSRSLNTDMVLHPGDAIDYVVVARDPEDAPLEYGMQVLGRTRTEWQSQPEFSVSIVDADIAALWMVRFFIRSNRSFHAMDPYDDEVVFMYKVLPRKRTGGTQPGRRAESAPGCARLGQGSDAGRASAHAQRCLLDGGVLGTTHCCRPTS